MQLNDTHPTLAIPELMRLLVDQYDMDWADAWKLCRQVFGYTNHTLLPEALETWPVQFFERFLPRHLEIIYRINEEFLLEVEKRFKGDGAAKTTLSIIGESHGRRVRMAHLAVVGCHKVNGVAKLHSELMQKTIFSGFAQMFPDRFTNVTNGITVRRWLKQSNPRLSRLLTERLGQRLGERSRGNRAAALGGGRSDFPRAVPRHQARQQDRAGGGGGPAHRHRRVGGFAVRRAGQAHPRVQAPAAEHPVRDHALQPHQGAARRTLGAAHGDVRRQGGAGLCDGQGHHPTH